jgi:chemotaxis protein MotB
MARKHQHEEHLNHEAWAIPYGDLVTLLLAFFVVMYSVSSVNEGKFRVLSDSLVAAFRGQPKTLKPVQTGQKQLGSGADIKISIVQQAMLQGQPKLYEHPIPAGEDKALKGRKSDEVKISKELMAVASQVEQAMSDLIDKSLLVVRRRTSYVEVDIRTDILFRSGEATVTPGAQEALEKLADALKGFPNPVRVEGHTDNRPINTAVFPSNWELSAARAASVVHLFSNRGVKPERLAVMGLGEYRPAQSNDTPEGRNANRRVLLVIMEAGKSAESMGSGASPHTTEEVPSAPAAEGAEPPPAIEAPAQTTASTG